MADQQTAEFVETLRMERTKRRIRQYALAAQIGVGQSALSGWESHRHLPPIAPLRRWAAALGVQVPTGVEGAAVRPAAKCGTVAAYQAHRRLGEPVCEQCRAAQTRYMAEWRRRRRAGGEP